MRSINDRLQEMTERINSGNVLESTGLGNEINFRVFDYDPEDEYIVREYLENYLLKKSKLNIKVFDIYDIIIEILKEDGFFSESFKYEQTEGIRELNGLISRILGIGTNENLINRKIKQNIEANQIIIITGIGKCYGIVRGHTILNNLHSIITKNPVIMFFPGTYNGQSFKLFNVLENDNYYRAFQFISRK